MHDPPPLGVFPPPTSMPPPLSHSHSPQFPLGCIFKDSSHRFSQQFNRAASYCIVLFTCYTACLFSIFITRKVHKKSQRSIHFHKSSEITFMINIVNKSNQAPFFNCYHLQPLRKFQVIPPPPPHVIQHIASPSICSSLPSEILKMILLPRLENFIQPPCPAHLSGGRTLSMNRPVSILFTRNSHFSIFLTGCGTSKLYLIMPGTSHHFFRLNLITENKDACL